MTSSRSRLLASRTASPSASTSTSIATPLHDSHSQSTVTTSPEMRASRSSRSHTPLAHSRRTADELTLEEASKKLLGTPLSRLQRSTVSGDEIFASGGSPRDVRHRKLVEAREKEEHEHELETDAGSVAESIRLGSVESNTPHPEDGRIHSVRGGKMSVGDSAAGSNGRRSKGARPSDITTQVEQSQLQQTRADVPVALSPSIPSTTTTVASDRRESLISTLDDSHDEEEDNAMTPRSVIEVAGIDEDEGLDNDTSSSGSDSDSDNDDSEEDLDQSSDSEDSDEEEDRLDKLLEKAKINALQQQMPKPVEIDETTGEVVLQFDVEEEEKKQAAIPDITVPALPRAHLAFNADGTARASSSSSSALPSKAGSLRLLDAKAGKAKAAVPALELDNRPYEKALSKKQKAAQPRKASASELWATLPTVRSDVLPQMKRDYQALSLANSLDPKRFMKGGSKLGKVPEVFAIGTLVDQPKHLQDTTLTRDSRYRPGQVVQDLVRDEATGSLAKRKYGDLQWKRMENGKGKGWKKRSKW